MIGYLDRPARSQAFFVKSLGTILAFIVRTVNFSAVICPDIANILHDPLKALEFEQWQVAKQFLNSFYELDLEKEGEPLNQDGFETSETLLRLAILSDDLDQWQRDWLAAGIRLEAQHITSRGRRAQHNFCDKKPSANVSVGCLASGNTTVALGSG